MFVINGCKIVDSRVAVFPATQAKNVKMVKSFSSLEPSPHWLGYRGPKSKVSKNWAIVPNFKANLRLGSRFGPLHIHRQNGSKLEKVFPPETGPCWLDDGPKNFFILAILAKVISHQSCPSGVYFFDILVCGREIIPSSEFIGLYLSTALLVFSTLYLRREFGFLK